MVQCQMETPLVPLSYCQGWRLGQGLARNRLVGGFPGKASDSQLAATFGQYLLVAPFKPGLWGNIGDPTVQAHRIVFLHKAGHDAPGIFEVERRLGSDAFPVDSLVPAFDLAVALWVEGRYPLGYGRRAVCARGSSRKGAHSP